VSDWIVKPPDEGCCSKPGAGINWTKSNVKVLVVEDDLDLARVLTAMFERHGIKTFHAQNRAGLIQLSQRIFPHLVVLDLVLPGATALL